MSTFTTLPTPPPPAPPAPLTPEHALNSFTPYAQPQQPQQPRYNVPISHDIDMSKAGMLGWFPIGIVFALGRDLLDYSKVTAEYWHDSGVRSLVAENGDAGAVLAVLLLWACYAVVIVYHAFGLVAGYQVFMRCKHAIVWVRWYVLLRLAMFSFFLWGDSFKDDKDWIPVLLSIFWVVYFARSERVRLTLGRNLFGRAVRS